MSYKSHIKEWISWELVCTKIQPVQVEPPNKPFKYGTVVSNLKKKKSNSIWTKKPL